MLPFCTLLKGELPCYRATDRIVTVAHHCAHCCRVGRPGALRSALSATLPMRRVFSPAPVIRNVNNAHIPSSSMNAVLTVLLTSLGPAPCVENRFSLSTTYEQCPTVLSLLSSLLIQGLFPRVRTFLTFLGYSCPTAEITPF